MKEHKNNKTLAARGNYKEKELLRTLKYRKRRRNERDKQEGGKGKGKKK